MVQRAVFSPDNQTVLTLGGGRDLSARLWNMETGKQIYSSSSGAGFSSLFFFPDGQTFYASDHAQNTSDGQPRKDVNIGGGTLALSPNGNIFVTGVNPDATLRDVSTGQVIRTLSGHTDSVVSAAFSKDGKMVVTGSWDNNARVWDVASGKLLLLLSANSGYVNSVAFSPDGTKVLTGSNTARLWSIAVDDPMQQTISASAGISSFALSPDGKQIVIGDVKGNNGLWEFSTRSLIHSNFVNYDVKDVAFSPDGKMEAYATNNSPNNCAFGVFDTTSGKLIKSFSVESIPTLRHVSRFFLR